MLQLTTSRFPPACCVTVHQHLDNSPGLRCFNCSEVKELDVFVFAYRRCPPHYLSHIDLQLTLSIKNRVRSSFYPFNSCSQPPLNSIHRHPRFSTMCARFLISAPLLAVFDIATNTKSRIRWSQSNHHFLQDSRRGQVTNKRRALRGSIFPMRFLSVPDMSLLNVELE